MSLILRRSAFVVMAVRQMRDISSSMSLSCCVREEKGLSSARALKGLSSAGAWRIGPVRGGRRDSAGVNGAGSVCCALCRCVVVIGGVVCNGDPRSLPQRVVEDGGVKRGVVGSGGRGLGVGVKLLVVKMPGVMVPGVMMGLGLAG